MVDTDLEEILCIRIRDEKNRYPTITYQEALYSQLGERHVGLTVLAQEIILEELKGPEHAAVWEQYCRERRDPEGKALEATEKHEARRLFLHLLSDHTRCLVVAQDLEIRYKQPKKPRYWEMGYRYPGICSDLPGKDD